MKKIKTEEDMKREFKLGGLGPAMAYRDENHFHTPLYALKPLSLLNKSTK